MQLPGAEALNIAVHEHAGLVPAKFTHHREVANPLLTGRQLEEALRGLNGTRNDLAELARRTAAGIRAMTGSVLAQLREATRPAHQQLAATRICSMDG